MPKIISDKGIELFFEDYDILKNGDIFIHGATKKGISEDLSQQWRPIPDSPVIKPHKLEVVPKYEPPNSKVRVAIKPIIKNRVGLMCPHCHQSRIFDTGYDEHFVIFEDENIVYDERINEIDVPSTTEELVSFNNEYLLVSVPCTMKTIVDNYKAEDIFGCPLCKAQPTIQELVNEYAFPTADYMNICFCGGEMCFSTNKDNILTCEVCGKEKDYDDSVV